MGAELTIAVALIILATIALWFTQTKPLTLQVIEETMADCPLKFYGMKYDRGYPRAEFRNNKLYVAYIVKVKESKLETITCKCVGYNGLLTITFVNCHLAELFL